MREVEHLEKGGSLVARLTLNPAKDLALACGVPLQLIENLHYSHRAWEQAYEEAEQAKTHARAVSSNRKKAFMEASHRVAEMRAAAKYVVAKDPQCNTLPKSLKTCKGSRRHTQSTLLQWWQASVVSVLNLPACSHHSLEQYGLAPKALRSVEQTVHKAETMYRSHLVAKSERSQAIKARNRLRVRFHEFHILIRSWIRDGIEKRSLAEQQTLRTILAEEVGL